MKRSMTTRLAAVLVATLVGTTPVAAQDDAQPFRSMTIQPEIDDSSIYKGSGPYGHRTLCVIPDPPVELTPTNGHEFAYAFWLEKMEMEKRLANGDCDCQVEDISWEEVGEVALPWLADRTRMFSEKRQAIIDDLVTLQSVIIEECFE